MVSGISHPKVSGVPNAAGNLVGGADFDAAHQIVDYVDYPKVAEPSPPAAGKVRNFAGTDGKMYSIDENGVVSGPFEEGGGADLSAFRLASIKDAPGDLALGAFGSEFEYADSAALAADGWTVNQGLLSPSGSCVLHSHSGGASVLAKAVSGWDSDWEVAFLISGHISNGGMVGITASDSSGNGRGFIAYSDGSTYDMGLSGWSYSGTGSGASGYTTWQDGLPTWVALRKTSGNVWRLRFSRDGTSWSTHSGYSGGITTTRVGFGRIYSGNGFPVMMNIHRFVYGTPDLGLG
jgi:hypothetical protein